MRVSVPVYRELFFFIDTYDAVTADAIWSGKSLCYSELVVASRCANNRGAIPDAERI